MTDHGIPDPMADISERLERVEARLADIGEQIGAPPKRWLRVPEASQYASLSGWSIRQLLARGLLTAHRPLKGSVRIDKLQLDSVLLAATRVPRVRRGQAGVAAMAARRQASGRGGAE